MHIASLAHDHFGVLHRSDHGLAAAAHLSPVVFVGGSAGQANLIVLPVFIGSRPRETVSATAMEELFQEIQCVTAWFRLFQWASQREKNGLWGVSRRVCSFESRTFGGWDLERNVSTELNLFSGNGP